MKRKLEKDIIPQVVLLDLDDTITKTTEYGTATLSERKSGNFIAEGVVDLFKKLQDAEIKVGVVTQSYGDLNPLKGLLFAELKKHNIELDAYISIKELEEQPIIKNKINPMLFSEENFTKRFHHLCEAYGKPEVYMAQLALQKMGLTSEKTSEPRVIMVGDQWYDIEFAKVINDDLGLDAKGIHINLGQLSEENILEAQASKPHAEVKTYKGLGLTIEELWEIDLGYSSKKARSDEDSKTDESAGKEDIQIGKKTISPRKISPQNILKEKNNIDLICYERL